MQLKGNNEYMSQFCTLIDLLLQKNFSVALPLLPLTCFGHKSIFQGHSDLCWHTAWLWPCDMKWGRTEVCWTSGWSFQSLILVSKVIAEVIPIKEIVSLKLMTVNNLFFMVITCSLIFLKFFINLQSSEQLSCLANCAEYDSILVKSFQGCLQRS